MKHVHVTMGTYAGRTLLMEDSVADAAVADGWGQDPENLEPPEEGTDLAAIERPQSLTDFEAAINEGQISIDTPGESDGGGDGGEGEGGGELPAPVLSSLVPNTAVLDSPDFVLSCMGSGFTAGSVIVFAGQDEPTTLVSDSEVTTGVKPSLGWGADTGIPVLVRNADGVESASLDFTFTPAVVY